MLASLLVPAISLSSSGLARADGLTPRSPIYIVGNAGFTPANGVVAGSGTAEDPYIIENWVISASTVNGIYIINTTAYFIIRNCLIENGRPSYHYGIYLYNAANGKIDNNIVANNYIGIYIYDSYNNILSNNLIENNRSYGVRLSYSYNNHIYHNNLINNVNQVHDIGSNYWDNGYPSGGNY